MKQKINNRELSWLQFNSRVLQEAQDRSVPLLQRLRFLGIYSNNQDEFIKVRLGNLIRYTDNKRAKYPIHITGDYTPEELLTEINEAMRVSQKEFRKTYKSIIQELEEHNIYMINESELTAEQMEFCRNYFLSVISVRLAPLVLRKSFKLPLLPDNQIYLAVKMDGGRSSRYAIVQIPSSKLCPRFVVLPSVENRTDIIFLDDIIRLFLDDIFFMFPYKEISAYTFKVVRDAELTIDDDISKSMSEKMYSGVNQRTKGRPVRVVYDKRMPEDMLAHLLKKLEAKSTTTIEPSSRYHLMRDLMKFPKVNDSLEMTSPKPIIHPQINPFDSILKVIRRKDILLSYPYHTFKHFIDFLREAAIDPRVISINITLYRIANNSKVLNALINAAKNGKNVTVLVELKARFDEEHNIEISDSLQEAGVKVVHSPEGLKVHSKLVLIERMESPNGLRGYVYVGTGNFNEDTASIYSDFGLLTYNQTIAEDARSVFNFLESPHKLYRYRKLMVSPYYLREQIEELILREMESAKQGKKAYFYAKLNSLTDEKLISLLYKASEAGVKIRLLVRGACCLIAGVKDMSKNIEVRSVVDRYLEHARMIIVCNNNKTESYIMSADLMTRNLNRRVEVGVKIEDRGIHASLCDYFDIQWNDNVKARYTTPTSGNIYVTETTKESGYRCQDELYRYYADKK